MKEVVKTDADIDFWGVSDKGHKSEQDTGCIRAFEGLAKAALHIDENYYF